MKELALVLAGIQQKLVAPKNQKNTFAKFNYRTCEGILEAVKPLLDDCTLILTDDMVEVANKAYVKATAQISNGKDSISVNGFAREAQSKKGMDEAQMTGTASSYARKYALSGLFAIDGNDDVDSMDNSKPAADIKVKSGSSMNDQKLLFNSPNASAVFHTWTQARKDAVWKIMNPDLQLRINQGQ